MLVHFFSCVSGSRTEGSSPPQAVGEDRGFRKTVCLKSFSLIVIEWLEWRLTPRQIEIKMSLSYQKAAKPNQNGQFHQKGITDWSAVAVIQQNWRVLFKISWKPTTFKMLEIHYLRQEHWRHLTAIFRPNWCFPQLFTTAGIGTNLLIVCKSKCTSIVSLFDNTDNCYYQTVCRWHSLQNSSSMNFIWWTKPYIVCIMYKPMDMHF